MVHKCASHDLQAKMKELQMRTMVLCVTPGYSHTPLTICNFLQMMSPMFFGTFVTTGSYLKSEHWLTTPVHQESVRKKHSYYISLWCLHLWNVCRYIYRYTSCLCVVFNTLSYPQIIVHICNPHLWALISLHTLPLLRRWRWEKLRRFEETRQPQLKNHAGAERKNWVL